MSERQRDSVLARLPEIAGRQIPEEVGGAAVLDDIPGVEVGDDIYLELAATKPEQLVVAASCRGETIGELTVGFGGVVSLVTVQCGISVEGTRAEDELSREAQQTYC